MSVDTPDSHAKFRESLGLPFALLADVGGELSRAYDSAMEHQGQTYSARKVVVVDKDGTIAYRDDKFEVGNDAEFEALLAALDKLQ